MPTTNIIGFSSYNKTELFDKPITTNPEGEKLLRDLLNKNYNIEIFLTKREIKPAYAKTSVGKSAYAFLHRIINKFFK